MRLKLFFFLYFAAIIVAKKAKEKPSWAKKNVQDYGDYELSKLYEQWEEDEEPVPNDELPDWDMKKIKPQLNPMDFDSADDIMKASKRGQQALISVSVRLQFLIWQTENKLRILVEWKSIEQGSK